MQPKKWERSLGKDSGQKTGCLANVGCVDGESKWANWGALWYDPDRVESSHREDEGDQREREKASQPPVVPSRKFPGENGHHPVLDKEPKDFTGLGDFIIAFDALQTLLTADSSDRLPPYLHS